MGRADLLEQWDEPANLPLTPHGVSPGSHEKVWWRCERGHRWQAAVYTRTGGHTDCPCCAGKKPWPGETDLAAVHPHLAAQWHPTKNGELRPEEVLPGSHRKVWWLCEHGHAWQAAIRSRAGGCGCPVCANRAIGADNSLAVTHPEPAAQWHPTKNGALTPDQVVAGSTRKVWWVCEQGHEWPAQIASRALEGKGCPYCAGRQVWPGFNDLASRRPELAAQWHPTRNLPLLPTQVTPCSNRKVWWRCDKGHDYRAYINHRSSMDSGCPYCANRKVLPGFNDLATVEPAVADQWHPTLNGALTPQMVTAGSRKRVWWECPLGHTWKAVIYSRAFDRKCGCPVCAGTVRPKGRAQTRISTSEEANIKTL